MNKTAIISIFLLLVLGISSCSEEPDYARTRLR
uniref:Uncharacterized protein n=1 Tax=Candidatus Kentrum sp. FM TaxID=2126340 RepID=A0A450SYJ5_9GAMM|nr:MAG: hypothetical protein BECKFM1743A_GA0114220_102308 [Candidatus Kentron sp. FM]VFJ76211.1 MAG: hypothetical protein BECKFM1743C_GA0114222_109172 [Candidatus Kentron sp. FM]VFK23188.1 MAG: hypothetical protein BECKFM1743B_GA0114221_109092 [Candidatus Kentron sp. FM]